MVKYTKTNKEGEIWTKKREMDREQIQNDYYQ